MATAGAEVRIYIILGAAILTEDCFCVVIGCFCLFTFNSAAVDGIDNLGGVIVAIFNGAVDVHASVSICIVVGNLLVNLVNKLV